MHQCGAQFMYRFITLSTLLLFKEDTNETPVLAGSHSRTSLYVNSDSNASSLNLANQLSGVLVDH